jgi:hypothetical protein
LPQAKLIPAAVRNEGEEPASFCVHFGQWSYHDDQVETTPIPFEVQAPVKRNLKHLFRKHRMATALCVKTSVLEVAPDKNHFETTLHQR